MAVPQTFAAADGGTVAQATTTVAPGAKRVPAIRPQVPTMSRLQIS